MRKLLRPLRRLFGRTLPACVIAAAAMLLSRQAQGQASITISNASINELQNALIGGFTNIILAFNGTLNPTAPLEVVEDVTVDATGFSVIIGGTSNQTFYVDPGINFTLINVTLSGAANSAQPGTAGSTGSNGGTKGGNGGSGINGSDALGGAVYNAGNSTFIDCLFLTNAAIGGIGGTGGTGGNGSSTGGNGGNGGNGGGGYGGAIYNLGTVLLSNCSVAGNATFGGSGAAGGTNGSGPFASYAGAGGAGGIGSGAGIYNLGTATIINTTFNQNACFGGAASQSGGGVPSGNGNGAAGPAGPVSEGGAICNFGTNAFLNCTFFANTATGGTGGNGGPANTSGLGKGGNGGSGGSAYGGGIYNAPGAIVAVTNCTFSSEFVTGGTNGVAGSGNFAGANGSPGGAVGANIANLNTGATFLLKNSILDFPTNATSAYGTITDQGNNLSSDATPTFTTTNSFNNKDPKLSPSGLQANNSAFALTIALSANSPAIDAIYDNSAPPYDERTFPRPGGLRSDIGAFEFGVFATNFNVGGQVTVGGNPFPGVTVTAGSAATTVTDTNGMFEFSLLASNTYVIRPNPVGYFSPFASSVLVQSNTSALLFTATNARATVTNIVTTNGSNLNLSFAGIPGFTYVIQAATNLNPAPVTWTNLSTNSSGSSGTITFSYSLTGTNLTNFSRRFFRATIP